ncbi:MAG: hypothetical protein AB1599_10805, partial [Planctomycetota bacterium]
LTLVSGGFAATVNWDDGGSGHDFGTAANWDTDSIPVSDDVLRIYSPAAKDPNGPVISSGTYPATGAYGAITLGGASADTNAAVLTVNGGSLAGSTISVGSAGGVGKLKVGPGATLNSSAGLLVGTGVSSAAVTTGYLEITGGTLNITGTAANPMIIGRLGVNNVAGNKGVGIAAMSGGVINVTVSNFVVGQGYNTNATGDDYGEANGTFNFTGGTINAPVSFIIGYSQTGQAANIGDLKAIGTMTMSGATTTLNVTGSFLVGYLLNGNTRTYTSGTFTMDGGNLNIAAGDKGGFFVALENYGTTCDMDAVLTINGGTITITGATNPYFEVGSGMNNTSSSDPGGVINATLNINGGTIVHNGPAAMTMYIGKQSYKDVEIHAALNMTGGLLKNTVGGLMAPWRYANTNPNHTTKIQMTGGTIDLTGSLSVGFLKTGYPDSDCDVNFFGGQIYAASLTIADGSHMKIKNDAVLTLPGNMVSSLNTLIDVKKISTDPLGGLQVVYDDNNDVTRLSCTGPVYDNDLNGDHIVNFKDFVILASEWSNSGCEAADYYCYGADIDHDGEVTVTDAAIFSGQWLDYVGTAANVVAYYTFDDDVYDSTVNKYDGT